MRRSVLVIIGIAAILLMGLIAVLLSGGNNTQKTTPAASTQPRDRSEIKVYYISLSNVAGSATLVGCNDGLVATRILIAGSNNGLPEIYQQQLSLPAQLPQPGVDNALSRSKLKFSDARIENGTAFVNVTGELITGDACDKARVRAQLENPALQVPGVNNVVVRVNGFLLEELF